MKSVKVHPIRSASIILWGDDGNVEHTLIKGKNCEGSVISFDKRQIWTVYPYKKYSNDTRYCGACERNGVYIRLMPKDFCRIFGTNPFDAQAESEDEEMTEEDKLYADELRKRAYSDCERLGSAINELERQTCDTPRNNLAESSQDCIIREEAIRIAEQGQIQGYEWQFKELCNLPSVTPSYNSIKTELKPCEDCISREAVIRLVEQYPDIMGNRCSGLIADIKHLPSVTPKAESEG